MERKTRKPTQKRALEKMDKIIDAAFKLFNEKGYYSTTTADIAAEANVATGSVYAYFQDKKDIYLHVLKKTSDSFEYPTRDFWIENINKDLKDSNVAKELFTKFIELMVRYHVFSKTFRDEQNALILLDKDISAQVNKERANRDNKIIEIFNILNITFKSDADLKIFCYYCNLLVDDVCHKIVYDETITNSELYISRCCDMIYALFASTTDLK